MRLITRILTAAALVLVAVFLSGCFVITSETTRQLDVIGDVEIATAACTTAGPTSCPNGNSGPASFTNYLIAYRIEDGVGAPDTITAASGDAITSTSTRRIRTR
jgi:hypothetical protein